MGQSDHDERGFPWPDVDASRANRRLQREHPPAEARERYSADLAACPTCGAAPDTLAWFWFETPDWTWEALCGRAGWLTVCDGCRTQVDFFLEILN